MSAIKVDLLRLLLPPRFSDESVPVRAAWRMPATAQWHAEQFDSVAEVAPRFAAKRVEVCPHPRRGRSLRLPDHRAGPATAGLPGVAGIGPARQCGDQALGSVPFVAPTLAVCGLRAVRAGAGRRLYAGQLRMGIGLAVRARVAPHGLRAGVSVAGTLAAGPGRSAPRAVGHSVPLVRFRTTGRPPCRPLRRHAAA